jgi:hypothetical protein
LIKSKQGRFFSPAVLCSSNILPLSSLFALASDDKQQNNIDEITQISKKLA